MELPFRPMSSRRLAIASFVSHRRCLHALRLTHSSSPSLPSSPSCRFDTLPQALQAHGNSRSPLALLGHTRLRLQRRAALQRSPSSSCTPRTSTSTFASTFCNTSCSRRGSQYALHLAIHQVFAHSSTPASRLIHRLYYPSPISQSRQSTGVSFAKERSINQIGGSLGNYFSPLLPNIAWRSRISYSRCKTPPQRAHTKFDQTVRWIDLNIRGFELSNFRHRMSASASQRLNLGF